MNPKLLEALLQLHYMMQDKAKRTTIMRGMGAKDQDDLRAITDQITHFLVEEGHVG